MSSLLELTNFFSISPAHPVPRPKVRLLCHGVLCWQQITHDHTLTATFTRRTRPHTEQQLTIIHHRDAITTLRPLLSTTFISQRLPFSKKAEPDTPSRNI